MANYVDNNKFLQEISKYRVLYLEAQEVSEVLKNTLEEYKNDGEDHDKINALEDKIKKKLYYPRLSEYLGECFFKIANNYSHNSNWCNYPFREDMVSNAMLDCTRYAHNFDPNKTTNPFAYFTRICQWAFVRTIKKEKKDLYGKFKMIRESEIMNTLYTHVDHDPNIKMIIDDIGYSEGAREKMDEYVYRYEDSIEKKKIQQAEAAAAAEAESVETPETEKE